MCWHDRRAVVFFRRSRPASPQAEQSQSTILACAGQLCTTSLRLHTGQQELSAAGCNWSLQNAEGLLDTIPDTSGWVQLAIPPMTEKVRCAGQRHM